MASLQNPTKKPRWRRGQSQQLGETLQKQPKIGAAIGSMESMEHRKATLNKACHRDKEGKEKQGEFPRPFPR